MSDTDQSILFLIEKILDSRQQIEGNNEILGDLSSLEGKVGENKVQLEMILSEREDIMAKESALTAITLNDEAKMQNYTDFFKEKLAKFEEKISSITNNDSNNDEHAEQILKLQTSLNNVLHSHQQLQSRFGYLTIFTFFLTLLTVFLAVFNGRIREKLSTFYAREKEPLILDDEKRLKGFVK
jgi:hypothetical protein